MSRRLWPFCWFYRVRLLPLACIQWILSSLYDTFFFLSSPFSPRWTNGLTEADVGKLERDMFIIWSFFSSSTVFNFQFVFFSPHHGIGKKKRKKKKKKLKIKKMHISPVMTQEDRQGRGTVERDLAHCSIRGYAAGEWKGGGQRVTEGPREERGENYWKNPCSLGFFFLPPIGWRGLGYEGVETERYL